MKDTSGVEKRKARIPFNGRLGKTGSSGGRAESERRMELFWKLELMPASLILRTSSSYRLLSASASRLRALYSKDRALRRSDSSLVAATPGLSMFSRLADSWYSRLTRCVMLALKEAN